ncbi:hypothetical protein DICPUDRAFT_153287 [Dictyostelium purpureum]|uniref:Sodium/calcium exchanger membrane region domain-containing protein n=1 Tax=Dictyostelium purpureum TaxID=5786 RepID=F0ZNJ3_DICPU|nr:uncharacterized protein DICPUDRAFT_153287 [Dictyostelium purpureum]EGC34495.1 hypothetical protein DICPUDRAFT_153287 [Dictyostelium purpureum]|eukprot:XP_003288984.1 hypothetical protein DICPUDRAFT_153287 [Dictyostelium purpureum]
MKIINRLVLLFSIFVLSANLTESRNVISISGFKPVITSSNGIKTIATYSNVTIPSTADDACSYCSANVTSYYCPDSQLCITNVTSLEDWPSCSSGWCNSDSCQCEAKCLNSIWPCTNNIVGMLFLMAVYGSILALGAKFISDGSEGLLEILDPGLIGGLVLPILSAAPDAIIILVSGAFSSNPQAQLAIGIGTLAGSTIMLLTIPFSSSLILARCDLRGGESVDGVLTHKWSLTKTGVTVDDDTKVGAKIMMGVSISYLIVQGVAFAYLHDPEDGRRVEKWFSLAGLIVCALLMAAYCVYQVVQPKLQEKKMENAKKNYLTKRIVHHFIHNLTIKKNLFNHNHGEEGSSSNEHNEESPLIGEEHKKLPVDVKGIGLKWKAKAHEKAQKREETSIQVNEAKEDGDDHEEHGPINKKKIALQSAGYLILGTVLVSLFSDPMVDVISDFGTKLNIKLFFVSFILTPFCSNASELISSLIFASKKKKQNSSLTFSALYGSCSMNSTMCLGIFFALVYFRNLVWEYSAETIAILFVTLSVGTLGATQNTMKTYMAPLVLSLYPLSLLLVYLLETFANWQ